MKAQACIFKRNKDSKFEDGIAIVKTFNDVNQNNIICVIDEVGNNIHKSYYDFDFQSRTTKVYRY